MGQIISTHVAPKTMATPEYSAEANKYMDPLDMRNPRTVRKPQKVNVDRNIIFSPRTSESNNGTSVRKPISTTMTYTSFKNPPKKEIERKE